MKKLICALVLIQSGFMMAQTETLVTNNGKKVQVNMNAFTDADNGLTVTNQKVQLGGTLLEPTALVTSSSASLALKGLQDGVATDKILVADTNGILKWVSPATIVQANQVQADWNQTVETDPSYILNRASIPVVPNIIPTDVGTVIAINGQLQVAQEITSQMNADFVTTNSNVITPIGNITNVIIDNKSKFISSATTNRFTVDEDGIYSITMNAQVTATNNAAPADNQSIVIGVVDNTTGKWITRTSDAYMYKGYWFTYTLIISAPMLAGHTYSFATSGNYTTTIYAFTSGSTGIGSISYYSVKRLK